jgi:hypothetical protein
MTPPDDDERERTLDDLAERVADGRDLPQRSADAPRAVENLYRLAALHETFAAQRSQLRQAPQEPTQWGHLQIRGRLGAGGFGVVYNAFDPVLQREVALKLRRVERADDADALVHIDEARRMARVRHPYVLAIHGASIHEGRAGIWADRVDGETVQQRMERAGALPRAELMRMAEQLLQAVQAIHAQGLAHGDIKASNVMIEGARAILMDFGAALPLGAHPRYGSPASMAPEVLAGGPASAAADVYALGALLYRMAVGDAATEGDDARGVRTLRRALGVPLATLVTDMRASDAAARPSVAEIAVRLARIAALPQRRMRWIAMSLVFGALGVGLVSSLVALRSMQVERDRTRAVKNVMLESALAAVPQRQSGPGSLRTLFENIAARAPLALNAYPEAQAELLLVGGRGLFDLGESEQGLALAERGLALIDMLPDYPRVEHADALQLVGMMRRKHADPDGAERALREAIELFEADGQRAEHMVAIARVRASLANVLGSRGDWLGAAQAHQAAVAERAALPGVGEAERAADRYNLGLARYRLNQCAAARGDFSAAMQALTRAGLSESLRAAFVLHTWAQTENCLGAPQRALEYIAAARTLYLREYPADHVMLARLANVEAASLRAMGRPVDALALIAQHDFAAKGDAPPTEMLTLRARLCADLGRWADARADVALASRNLTQADAPLRPYLHAAAAWYAYRGGSAAEPPHAALDRALHEMRAAGYAGLREFKEIERWRASLETVAQ